MEYLDRTELEAEHLDKLIGQLLTLAKIDSGADSSHLETFDLVNLMQEVAADGNFEAQSRCCSVKVDSVDACIVKGVAENLRRAVENPVRNAIRFTKPNTAVEITLHRRGTPSGSLAVIQIRDHGPGVPPAELKKIFLPFHRVANASASDGGGLGLAITERVIRMHGGNVRASNASDGGLVVEMELPLIG
jgi:two-component system sensor histidine kinase CpxA